MFAAHPPFYTAPTIWPLFPGVANNFSQVAIVYYYDIFIVTIIAAINKIGYNNSYCILYYHSKPEIITMLGYYQGHHSYKQCNM